MATESITKSYTIKDNKACDILIKVTSEATKRKKPDKPSTKYEEGKKLLEQYFPH